MRKLIFLLIPILFIAMPLVSHGDESSATAKPKPKPAVYGVLFYADWCGSCKALDPKVAEARKEAKLDSQDILFVTLNLTDETTKHQAAMMAATLGIFDLYESNSGNTGFMLLLNAETGEKLAQLTKKMKVGDIATRIQESVNSVKS
jgi:thiol-disulfide isomerase/thioredoxin